MHNKRWPLLMILLHVQKACVKNLMSLEVIKKK